MDVQIRTPSKQQVEEENRSLYRHLQLISSFPFDFLKFSLFRVLPVLEEFILPCHDVRTH